MKLVSRSPVAKQYDGMPAGFEHCLGLRFDIQYTYILSMHISVLSMAIEYNEYRTSKLLIY